MAELNSFLTSIADAIRSKKGTTEKINASNFASEIEKIQTGIEPTGTLDITENGEHNVREYDKVNVNVASSGGETYNGEYQVIPSITEQILETKNKYLIDNVTVTQIPYHTVSNESGGKTVTIGETPTDKNGETILLSL